MKRSHLRSRRRCGALQATALLVGMLLAVPALAAVGVGVSDPAIIDTLPPEILIDPLPPFLLMQGGQTVAFHWTTIDANPGQSAEKFTANLLVESMPVADRNYYPDISGHTWDLVLPEISSGDVRLSVRCVDDFGNVAVVVGDRFSVILSTSDVPGATTPLVPVLEGNAPNPCNPGTVVSFSLPGLQRVVLDLYAADGSLVRRLADATFDGGRHEVFWDGRDTRGRSAASGTYLLQMTAGRQQQSRKIALVR